MSKYLSRFKLIVIIILLCVTIGVVAFFLIPRNQIVVTPAVSELGSSFWMKIDNFNPPLFISAGVLESDVHRPNWLKGYAATVQNPPLTYNDFKKAVTSEFIKQYKITENAYNAVLKEKREPGEPKITIFYTINVYSKSGQFLLLVKSVQGYLSEIPSPNDLSVSLLKKDGGTWKAFPMNPKGGLNMLPWNNVEKLQALLKAKKCTLVKSGYLEPI